MAARLGRVQVIAAYPITPQTSIAENLAAAVARNELKARYIRVESETSALAACIGGALAGARSFTATSSQGLALMHELLHWVSGSRLPMVLVNVNRSMAAPWSLGVDHTDTLAQRDTGWMQIYCETAQEVFDLVLIAIKLSEQALLPCMVCVDGFFLSHYSEPVDLPEQADVDSFLPRRKASFSLDPRHPCTIGGGVSGGVLAQLRHRLQADMEDATRRFAGAAQQYARRFGRKHRVVEVLAPGGCDLALVTAGTLAGTVKAYIRETGAARGVGLIKVKMFRPFPKQEICRALGRFRQAVVIDRNLSPGSGGIFAQEIRDCLYSRRVEMPVAAVIGGLGGVDVTPAHLDRLVAQVRKADAAETIWLSG